MTEQGDEGRCRFESSIKMNEMKEEKRKNVSEIVPKVGVTG